MQSLPLRKERERPCTLVVHGETIWIWPGIPPTLRRGGEIIPVSSEVIHFWISRLHGPEALYADSPSTLSRAARVLKIGDAVRAQHLLDALKLTALSPDGAALMRALAGELDIAAMNLPVHFGPRTWNARDIALHCLLFKEHVEAARVLAKGVAGPWDEAKHPRWSAGAPESQGGRFAPSAGSGGTSISTEPPYVPQPLQTGRSSSGENDTPEKQDESGKVCLLPDQPGIGDNGGPPFDPDEEPPEDKRTERIKAIASWIANLDAAGLETAADAFMTGLEAIAWLKGDSKTIAQLQADRDPPKTLEELYQNEAGPGYENHHIVEKTPAKEFGFLRAQIEAPENKVYIPTLKHRKISAWYQTKLPNFGGLSPRDYLRDKEWYVRRRIGIEALKKFGVLKE